MVVQEANSTLRTMQQDNEFRLSLGYIGETLSQRKAK